MLSLFHHAVEAQVKKNYLGNAVIKPVIVDDYNKKMNSVDHSDHMLSMYKTLKSIKWYRKLILHLIKYGRSQCIYLEQEIWHTKMSHSSY